MEETWEEFTSRAHDEYDVWTGSPDMTAECEECGKEFEFRGVDID